MGGYKSLFQTSLSEFLGHKIVKINALLLIVVVLLIGLVYSAGVIEGIPAAIVDLDGTSASRLMIQQFEQNNKFSVVYHERNTQDLKQLITSGNVDIGFVIPPRFSQDIKAQKGTEVLVLIDGTNYIIGNNALAAASEIIQTMNAGIAMKTLQGKGEIPDRIEKLISTIQFKRRILFNPAYNYFNYLGIGIYSSAIFSLLMSAFGIFFIDWRKNKDTIHLPEFISQIALVSFFNTIMINIVFVLSIILFKVPVNGGYWGVFLLSLPQGILITGLALITSAIAKDEIKALQLNVFFATTLFFVTGYSWPVHMMPPLLRGLSYICPLTPFNMGARAVLVMGVTFFTVLKYFLWILGLAVIYLPLGSWLYCGAKNRMTAFQTNEAVEELSSFK